MLQAEMLLKQALLGRQMIELVLPQQAGREAPRQHGPQRRGWRDSLGSLGMLAGRALGDVDSSDSSEEEPSSSAGPTYFAGSSNGGSPGARGSASGGGRGSPPVRLPPAEELVQLQQVADGLVGLTFEEAFERCSLVSGSGSYNTSRGGPSTCMCPPRLSFCVLPHRPPSLPACPFSPHCPCSPARNASTLCCWPPGRWSWPGVRPSSSI